MNIWKEILHILQTVTEQNCFQFDQQYYKQTEGLAMGAPTLSVLAEAHMQHMEHKQIYPILKKQIIAFFRYVDDIIYDQNKTINKHSRIQQTTTICKIYCRKRNT
jgi:glutamine synthetase type III